MTERCHLSNEIIEDHLIFCLLKNWRRRSSRRERRRSRPVKAARAVLLSFDVASVGCEV